MRVLELFAGAGGASVGIARAGATSVRCIEWDKDAVATAQAAGHPAVQGDVRDPSLYADLPPIDLLWASPPCQAFSSAGKKLGAADDRNGWPWTLDAIDRLRAAGKGPTWVICENVQGLTHFAGDCTGVGAPTCCAGHYWTGWILPEFRRRFAHVQHATLDAASFGVPQRRHRVFLVAGPQPIRWPSPTHADPATLAQGSLFGPRLLPWVTVRQALGLGTPQGRSAASGCAAPLVQFLRSGGVYAPSRGREAPSPVDRPSPTVTGGVKGGGKGGNIYLHSQLSPDPKHAPTSVDAPAVTIRGGGDGHGAPHYFVGPAIEDTLRDDAIPSGWCSEANQSAADYRVVKSLDRPISTITAGSENSHGASCLALTFGAPEGETIPVGAPRVKPPAKADPRIAALAGSEPTLLDQPSAPVLARDGKGTSISPSSLGRSMITSASDSAYLGAGIRRLTVEECAILQAFPADYPWRGTKTAQYRQVGNAVCPPVAEALVRAVLDQHPDQLRGRIEQFPADPPPLVGGELPPAR